MISDFDKYVLEAAAKIAGQWPVFDKLVVNFTDLPSVKMLPLILVVVYIWSRSAECAEKMTAISALCSSFMAVFVARSLANSLPMRLRPLHSGDPLFKAPIGVGQSLEHWSSFPSDHAALTFALSTAIWQRDRRLGVFCYLWSALVVCLPRVYAGYHYASDVLGGAVIGMICAYIVGRLALKELIFGFIRNIATRNPAFVAMLLFALLFEFVMMFTDVRVAASGLFKSIG